MLAATRPLVTMVGVTETVEPARTPTEHAFGSEHRDVNGGWLRPAVFGMMDGLVTNVSLIAGVGGAVASPATPSC